MSDAAQMAVKKSTEKIDCMLATGRFRRYSINCIGDSPPEVPVLAQLEMQIERLLPSYYWDFGVYGTWLAPCLLRGACVRYVVNVWSSASRTISTWKRSPGVGWRLV